MRRHRHIIWTDLMDEYLMVKRSKGELFQDIASILGVRRTSVMRRYKMLCAERGVERYQWRNGKHPHQTRRQVIQMKLAGSKITEIAATVGLGEGQAYGIWSRWRYSQSGSHAP